MCYKEVRGGVKGTKRTTVDDCLVMPLVGCKKASHFKDNQSTYTSDLDPNRINQARTWDTPQSNLHEYSLCQIPSRDSECNVISNTGEETAVL